MRVCIDILLLEMIEYKMNIFELTLISSVNKVAHHLGWYSYK